MISIFYNLIIEPIVIVYELVYGLTKHFIYNARIKELSIICILVVSIAFNLLTYPLYKKADNLQSEVRLKKDKMSKWVDHIKKNFKGDERYFILSTYYKENNYSPFDQIKESLSLLIQIPFFAAAYIFFTSIDFSYEMALGVIPLGAEDALLNIGEISINVLPILMTIINLISASIYTKGFKLKDKISSFILPLVFLIILYRSPSALVIYWTFNNIISLIKNIILKNKSNKKQENTEIKETKNNINVIWITISIFLFLALVIPTQVIKASPEEFDSIYYSLYDFVLYNANVFLGFALWIIIFYIFSNNKKRFIFVLTVINIYFLFNHMLYINDVGFVTTLLIFDMPLIPITDIALNVLYLLLIIFVLKVISIKFDIVSLLTRAMCISLALWSIINIAYIVKAMNIDLYNIQPNYVYKIESEDLATKLVGSKEAKKSYIMYMQKNEPNSRVEDGSKPVFNISKKGKNVIFICLDCFTAEYYKYAIAIMPELKEKLDGFKVYTNTFSFGPHTRVGAPAMYGGYEYSPYEINKRKDELVVKHNEAITLMPKMFSDEGYNVTTMDIPWENYYDASRGSLWKDMPKVTNIHMVDTIKSKMIEEKSIETKNTMQKRFVQYSIMKTSPLIFKIPLYNDGQYLYHVKNNNNNAYTMFFLQSFEILDRLSKLANIVDDDNNNVFITHNSMVHENGLLGYPDFYPTNKYVDTSYLEVSKSNDEKIFMGDKRALSDHVAALKELAEFVDFLKENNVYDNTRIIITADHGDRLVRNEFDAEYNVDDNTDINMLRFNPILMIKDFNAKGFEESDELMSNADAPYLALKGISKDMKNPYTGKEITMDYKKENDKIYVIGNVNAYTNYHIGRSQFHPLYGVWGVFSGDNVMDHNDWSLDTEIEKRSCYLGYEHNITYRKKTEIEKCGTNYLRDMYECSICGKCFNDEGGVEMIENYEQYKYEIPHKFTNYISDNNDSEKNHGTKTAYCDNGCGTKDTIYDDSINMHHHFVKMLKKANMTSDGYLGSVCDKCNLFEPNKDVKIIPALKEVKLENEYVEMTGDKNNAKVLALDKNGNEISGDNIEVKYFNNDNVGDAYAIVKIKNYYEITDETYDATEYDYDTNINNKGIRLDYKIVPSRVEIKSIEHKRGNLIVKIETGKGRINDVEIVVNDKDDEVFTFKKTQKNEYKVNLTEFNNEAKQIRVRGVRYNNVTGEALYSPWVEGEVE